MNEKIKIRAQSQNVLVFYWNNTLGIDQFEAENYDGPLWIKAENDCGADSALTLVRTIDCECRLWFPNAFTPNTDQLNDDFRPQGDCKLLSFQWWIYNRWGELIYSGTDPESGWNGQINGRNAPVGTYFYRAEYEGVTNLGKERFQRAAIFHLLR
jgi:gliding motility-associated-like protein